ncbi:MAG: response regulator [Pseudomonadota bacterium]
MAQKIQTAMIIDDEIIDQKQYKRVMKRSGLVEEVLTFSYAEDAFEYLKANTKATIDVIFLDINMPRMNGFEFLEKVSRELHREVAQVVLIMLTTSIDPRDRERARTFDLVRDFINKPLEFSHVEHAADLVAEARGAVPS